MRYLYSIIVSSALLLSQPAGAACKNTGDFGDWLKDFKASAIAEGLKPAVVDNALMGVRLDEGIIRRDRSQQLFAQDFLTFAGQKVVGYRLDKGRGLLRQNAALLKRIERDYGVPGEVLTALWGLESDFGEVTGSFPTLRALASLAYDCRRPDLFRKELLHALWLVQKGDLAPAGMRGAWAGELGQLQFLASRYDQYGVDYDGDGKRNLIRSKADALASGANMLDHYGWRAGEPWLREVRVPKSMDWSQARLGNKLSLSHWAEQGVSNADGSPLRGSGVAALLLPMGRNGPAFLAFPNFDVFLAWNESTVYSATAAYFATRLAGAKALKRGNAPVKVLSMGQVRQVQTKLKARGLRITKVDGIIGDETRDAVRAVQQQLNLPADGYPDAELLEHL